MNVEMASVRCHAPRWVYLASQRFIRERRSNVVIDLVAIEGPLGIIDQCLH
jgi:hypothetical protein